MEHQPLLLQQSGGGQYQQQQQQSGYYVSPSAPPHATSMSYGVTAITTSPSPSLQFSQQYQQQQGGEGSYNPQYQQQQETNYSSSSPYNVIPQPQPQPPLQTSSSSSTPIPTTTSAGYFSIPQGGAAAAHPPPIPQHWNRGYEEAMAPSTPIEVNTTIYIQAAPQYFSTLRQEVQQQCTLPPIYANEHGRNKFGVSFFSIFPAIFNLLLLVCVAVFEGFQYFGNRNFALYGRIIIYPSLVICHIVYWITCLKSDTVKFLWTLGDPYNLAAKINNIKATAPRIYMHVNCYHYRTHVHTHRDKDGRLRHEHRREKVTTFAETREVFINQWRDLSPDLSVIDISPTKRFLKLYVDNYIVPDSELTRNVIVNTFESFKSWNRWRDRYMDFYVTYEIPGMTSCILCKTEDGKKVPPFFGLFWYLLASCLYLNYPYKMYVDKFCQSQVFPVVKHITVR